MRREIQRGGELRVYLHDRQAKAVAALEAMAEKDFLADPDRAVEQLYAEYVLCALEVGTREQVTSNGTQATTLERRDPFFGDSQSVRGTRVTLHIPFNGPAVLWGLRASRWYSTAAYEYLSLGTGEFIFTYTDVNPTPEQIARALDQSIGQLHDTASWINNDVAAWLPNLRAGLESAATSRREHLAGVTALDAALGIPVRAVDSARQVPLPVQRKPVKPRVSSSTVEAAKQFLADDVYQDIVHTIEQMTRAMERTPTAARLGEEEIRDLILFVLNANYEGNVRGEVFNGYGKTDLLLTWEGGNAFIGECKIWKGPKKFREAIDQLLRYVTWRDTKAALVLFIKSGVPTQILIKADAEITQHTCYIESKLAGSGTRRDYVLHAPSDPSRRIDLAVVLVVIPPGTISASEPAKGHEAGVPETL